VGGAFLVRADRVDGARLPATLAVEGLGRAGVLVGVVDFFPVDLVVADLLVAGRGAGVPVLDSAAAAASRLSASSTCARISSAMMLRASTRAWARSRLA
jgi:hypothetical protein